MSDYTSFPKERIKYANNDKSLEKKLENYADIARWTRTFQTSRLERASQVSAIINAENVERVFSTRYSLVPRVTNR